MNLIQRIGFSVNKNNYEYIKKRIEKSNDSNYVTYLIDHIDSNILDLDLIKLSLRKGYCISNNTPSQIQDYINKKKILDNIKKGKEITYLESSKLEIDDLLTVDDNNITYLEYVCKNDIRLTLSLKDAILNNLQALYVCAKNNYLSWIMIIENEDIFFENVDGSKKLIEYIFENNINCGINFIWSFKNHYEIIDYIIKYKIDSIYELSSTLLEKLFIEDNGKFIIDKYINNEQVIKIIVSQISVELLINYCKIKGNYEILKYGNESCLSYKLENGKMVIEELLDRGIEPLFSHSYVNNKEIIDSLIKKNRIDLLYNADIELLLSNYNDNESYFDLMINEQKKGVDVHFEKLAYNYFRKPSKLTALELLKMAQNDIIGFVPEITDDMLLYKGNTDKKSVIEYLVEMDKDLTVSKIISNVRKKRDPNFVIVLRNLGIDESLIKIQTNDLSFSDKYIDQFNQNYTTDNISCCPELLYELKELFYGDGQSDKGAIEALIISYQFLTSINNPNNEMFILELKKLIEIKKQNMDNFVYKKHIDRSCFSSNSGNIFLNYNSISTINHETSHALHFYLSDAFIPNNYAEIIDRVRNNLDTIMRVKDYSIKFNNLKNRIFSEIDRVEISNYYDNLYTGDKLMELSSFLSLSKEEKKKMFLRDYQEQVLDTILARTYSVDEFIQQTKEIEEYELLDTILRNNYDAFCSIGDIIDAIYLGKLKNGVLYDEDGSFIEKSPGHGIRYFNKNLNHGFLEMIANYGTIIKSKNSNEILLYLRSIVGYEVVNMIQDVYENKILKLDSYIQDLEGESKYER